MTKTKKSALLFALFAVLALLLFAASVPARSAYAEEAPATSVQPAEGGLAGETPADEGTVGEGEDGLVARFIDALQEKYGDDYEFYLNAILEQWGSVEAYLLSLTDELPEEFQAGYSDFISWLGEYASIWAPCLAVALVIVILIIGRKALNTVLNRIVEARIKPIQEELNKQSAAQAAQLKATRALLGTNEKFAEERDAAEAAEKDLME